MSSLTWQFATAHFLPILFNHNLCYLMNYVVISITSYEKAQQAFIILYYIILYYYNSSFQLLIPIILQWILSSKHTLCEIYLKIIIFLNIKSVVSLYGFFWPTKMWRTSCSYPLYFFIVKKSCGRSILFVFFWSIKYSKGNYFPQCHPDAIWALSDPTLTPSGHQPDPIQTPSRNQSPDATHWDLLEILVWKFKRGNQLVLWCQKVIIN